MPQWSTKCKGYLTSAICGGQWPPSRKAKLPKSGGSDKCQLCHAAVGTIQHRHECPITLPTEGWTPFDSGTHKFSSGISEARRSALSTRGLLTVRIPIPEPQAASPGWRWLTDQPRSDLDDLTWVIDGSRRFASEWVLSTTGCGVAVVDPTGKLVAFATATPPPWVKTASAAEAWALLLTLRENPFPPRILTDCVGLLTAAKIGPAAATKGRKADARIWRLIDGITGDSFNQLRQALVWMPAHTSASGAVGRTKSDGKLLTTAEWRANNLADRLAKKGAANTPMRIAADKTIKAAGTALLQSAARLGVVTLAANCHKTQYLKENGETAVRVSRDSTPLPLVLAKAKLAKSEGKKATAPSAQPAPALPQPTVAPLSALTVAQERQKEKRARATADAAELALQTANAVATASAASAPPAVTATERMAALRRRLGLQ